MVGGRPSRDEVDHARQVIQAFEAAGRASNGVVTLDGRTIENLHVDNARRTLATAEAIAASPRGHAAPRAHRRPREPVTALT